MGATNPISGMTAKWASAERESEWPIVPVKAGKQKLARGKGPHLVHVPDGGKGW